MSMNFLVKNLPNWQIQVCSRCQNFLEEYYFVHQCYHRLPHQWCYNCLLEKGDCLRCGIPFSYIINPLQIEKEPEEEDSLLLTIGDIDIHVSTGIDFDWISMEDCQFDMECEGCEDCDECQRWADELAEKL